MANMNVIQKRCIQITLAVLVCFFLAGCAATGRHGTDRYEDNELLAGRHVPSLPEPEAEEITEEESKGWVTMRKAPEKEEGGRYVYLTFDDGPSPNTNRILDILSDFQIKATFFVVGKEILNNDFLEYEEAVTILQRVLAEGHYVGLHSMTHNMQRLYRAPGAHLNFHNEMQELQSLIYEITGGYEANLYRAPYGTRGMFTGDHIRQMSGSGLKGWDWSVDTEDWRRSSVNSVMGKIREDMEGRRYPDLVVVLFHEKNITIEALPVAIKYFQDLGYSFLPYHPDNHFQMNLIHHPDL